MPEEVLTATEADDTAADSSTEPTEGTEQVEETPAEGEKTETSEAQGDDLPEGQAIPYHRFKEVNDTKKRYEEELSGLRGRLNDPDVLRVLMKKEGYTDERIKQVLTQQGLKSADEQPGQRQYDFNTQEGWQQFIRDEITNAVNPVAQQFSQYQSKSWVRDQESGARDLAGKFDIEYGTSGIDETNPKTAIGKMYAYINKHPEDAALGHIKVLRLAMSEEGYKMGEQAGVEKERQRTEKLKKSQMEGDTHLSKDEMPSSDWDTARILAWSRKNNK